MAELSFHLDDKLANQFKKYLDGITEDLINAKNESMMIQYPKLTFDEFFRISLRLMENHLLTKGHFNRLPGKKIKKVIVSY